MRNEISPREEQEKTMLKMNSKRDIENWVDGCFQSTPTPEQFAAAVALVVDTAYDMGIEYGDDWSPALESLTIEDLKDASLNMLSVFILSNKTLLKISLARS